MLEEFIDANNLKATIIKCGNEVKSAKAAAEFLKVDLSGIAKTIVLLDKKNKLGLLVVLLGDCTVSIEKVSKAVDSTELDLATPEQTLEITGFNAGGVPPVSVFGAKTIVDKKVMGKETVFAGGGDSHSILKISPKEIEEFGFEVQIEDVCAD